MESLKVAPDTFVPTNPTEGYIFPADAVPQDSDPSHYILGAGNYYTTIHSYSATMFAFVVIAIMIVVIALILWYAFTRQRDVIVVEVPEIPPVRPFSLDANVNMEFGSSSNGTYASGFNGLSLRSPITCNGPNAGWIPLTAVCGCRNPFWGSTCEREVYDNRYISAGTVDLSKVSYTPSSMKQTVDSLSFPHSNSPPNTQSCTELCDNNSSCAGVVYDRGTGSCIPFSNMNIPDIASLHWDPDVDGNLYVKRSEVKNIPITINNRVFIFSGSIPLRPWNTVENVDLNRVSGNNFQAVKADILYNLRFTPEFRINDTGMTGVYSTVPFTLSEWSQLVKRGNTDAIYIDRPGTQFSYPINWTGLPVWVMYRNTK